ncbi:cytochrome P450 4C1-like isoform X2 [Adelges cooleyi]|uniref:cytochrome P450 4C1-like isoform X2 n=1 Tax=Adelges cooleyi TaxID=133065 RepID=UPI0021807EAA|nr:cytochrome P450 4C1-like isoform X2 [Adelges cooleyi]
MYFQKLQLNFFKCRYGKSLFKVWILDDLIVSVTKPEEIGQVLTNTKLFKRSKHYSVFHESFSIGKGIFFTDNFDEWKHNRKLVSEGLKFSTLKSYMPIFYEEANALGKVLYEQRDQISHECEISKAVSRATMEIIGRTTLGIQFGGQKNSKNHLLENIEFLQEVWEHRIAYPWLLKPILFRLSSLKRAHDESQSSLFKWLDDYVYKKIANSKNIDPVEHDKEHKAEEPKTLIDILLDNNPPMSFNQLRSELATVIVGGQDTTAIANACIIFMLAHHQDVQNKVYQEMSRIFSSDDTNRSPTYGDLQQMGYLECVIKETLRLYSPGPIHAKHVDEEVTIGDTLIPADSTILIVIRHVHLNPELYPEPETFNPDNFLPEACQKRPPYSFIPFSAGFRNCIGIKYAMLELKIVISTLVRSYKFSPADKCPTPQNLRLKCLGTLKFVDGCYVKIESRT